MISDERSLSSGVFGLTPGQVRERMADLGWHPLPIRRHDSPRSGAGKAPGINAWSDFARFDAPVPGADDLQAWARNHDEWPGTGVACGPVVGIDIDVADPKLSDDLESLAFAILGPSPFVRVGRAPRRMLVYRAAEAIAKRAFKAADGSGDGIDIQAEGSQFVAFGIHPTTGKPYRWTASEDPLTASPEVAPAITTSKVDAFVEAVSRLLPLSKTGGRGVRGGGMSAEIVRNSEGLVKDGREAHLVRCIWRAAMRLNDDGQTLTAETIADAAWADFTSTALVVVEGRERTRSECDAKARDLVRRLRTGATSLAPKIAAAKPSYPDDRVSLVDAEMACKNASGAFVEHAVAHKNRTAVWGMRGPGSKKLPPLPEMRCLPIETGVGKTEAAVNAIARGASSLAVVYAVPRTDLGDDLVERFSDAGITARVYRGREQPDPDALGETMCRNLKAVEAARKARANIFESCCETRPPGAAPIRCRFFEVCGHVRQRREEPRVWVVPHALLFLPRPAFIPLDALVIDESFAHNAVSAPPLTLLVSSLDAAPNLSGEERRSLSSWRVRLTRAFGPIDDRAIERADLAAAGIDIEMARVATELEAKSRTYPDLSPDLEEKELLRRSKHVAAWNVDVESRAKLAHLIAEFLDSGEAISGRLSVRIDSETGERRIEMRPFTPVHPSWLAPTLILDATPPRSETLGSALGFPVTKLPLVAAEWSPHVYVRQIVGAPVSSSKLGIGRSKRDDDEPRLYADLTRLILLRSAQVFPRKVAVVGQLDAIKRLEAGADFPPNVEFGHFNALAGRDDWKTVGAFVVFGRTIPSPVAVENEGSSLRGRPVDALGRDEAGHHSFYPKASGGIRLRDGSAIGTAFHRHPDPDAEEGRWRVCEANLIQAIGRIRPHRRGAAEPCIVDLISDVPLPIVVDEVITWGDAKVGGWAGMARDGVVLASAADIEMAFPDLAPSRKAARLAEPPTLALTPNNRFYLDVGASLTRPRRLRYKRKGRHPEREALVFANAGTGRHVSTFLRERLGPIEFMRLEGEAERVATRIAATVKAVTRVPSDVAWLLSGGSIVEAFKLAIETGEEGSN